MDTQPDTLQLVEDLRDSGAQVVALPGSDGQRGMTVLVCVEIVIFHAIEQRRRGQRRAMAVGRPK